MSDPSSSKYDVRRVFDEALSLFEQKNTDYRDSWRHQGWRGNLGRIFEKSDRLRTALWHGGPVGFAVAEEGARQTALDMLNTLAFFIINHDQRREWGHEDPVPEGWPHVPEAMRHEVSPGAWIQMNEHMTQTTDGRGRITITDHTKANANAAGLREEEKNPFQDGEENVPEATPLAPPPSPTPRRRVKDNPQA